LGVAQADGQRHVFLTQLWTQFWSENGTFFYDGIAAPNKSGRLLQLSIKS
jgi:hypothetical protein